MTNEVFNKAQVSVDSIEPNPLNPRKRFDEEKLQELAQSIREVGILQPLIITRGSLPDKYLLLAGERRLRAAKMAGIMHVPVRYSDLHFEGEDAKGQMSMMLIENLQREDLDPIEEARAFEVLTRDHGWKQTDLAEKIGVSQSHIANRIRLLNLPELAQEAISDGRLTASAGKELATLAKVPAVREIIEEAIADEENAQDIVWQARNAAYDATRPLHKESHPEPKFDTKGCEGCEHRVMLPGRYQREGLHPCCMDTKCWDEKQEAAIEEAAEKARQQVLATGDEVLRLSTLPYDTYKHFSGATFDQAECVQCVHHRKGRHSYMPPEGEPISVCLNPGCFKAKQAAVEKENRQREKELKAAHDERKEQMIADFFPRELIDEDEFQQEGPDFNALVYVTAQAIHNPPWSSSLSKAKVEAAVYDRYGWEKPEGLGWSDEVRHLVRQLATLTVSELLRLIFFVMLMPVEHDNRIFKAVYGEESGKDGGVDK